MSGWLRWLVLVLVVFDLASSPWHRHGHDIGADASHIAAWATQGHAPAAAGRGDRPEASAPLTATLRHSMAALPSGGDPPQADTTWFLLAAQDLQPRIPPAALASTVLARAVRELPAPPGAARWRSPDNRAPPQRLV